MSTSPIFEWLCTELVRRGPLDLPQSRGTVRLALKDAGLEPRTLTKDQTFVIIERVLPHELQVRGVANAVSLCTGLGQALRALKVEQTVPESAETIFARFGRK
jgi:hypothetical protein